MTAGLALRSRRSTSGGSGNFGIPFPLLAQIALDSEVRLIERRGPRVGDGVLGVVRLGVCGSCGDELVLAHSLLDALDPHCEVPPRELDVLRHVLDAGDNAEVDER